MCRVRWAGIGVNLFITRFIAAGHMSESTNYILSLPDEPQALPARRVLDCIFALTPAGRILHFHLGQLSEEATAEGVRFRLTAPDGAPERARCRVIPPLVPEFRR